MNVVLIYGGKSGEHEISLLSCASVIRAISSEHNVKLISVSKNGKWYLEDDSLFSEIRNDSSKKLEVHEDKNKQVMIFPGNDKNEVFYADKNYIPCDVIFPVMHGSYSEDGTIQGLFEMAGLPYVGCGVLASAVSMDKDTTKILWKASGLPVVPGICITKSDVNDSKRYDKIIDKAIEDFGFPLFVKPSSAGSSDGAKKAGSKRELNAALLEAFSWDNKVLIEKAINAREIECSVTGNSITEDAGLSCSMLTSYGPGEILPKHDFYDYDAKYTDPDGAELKIPALLDQEQLEYIRATAKKAYAAVNASGLSRVDFFIDKDTGKIYLNEINTLPGFTSISMFPKMCESEGLNQTKLIDFLMEEALASFTEKAKLCTSRN